MATIGRIAVDLVARTAKFAAGINKASNSLTSLGNTSSKIGGLMRSKLGFLLGAAGVSGGAAGMVQFVKAGEGFNSTFRKSTSIMGDLSDAMKSDMKAAAFEVAKTTKFSASQAAQAYFFLASAGMSAEQSLAAMPTVAKVAQAGQFDLALATDLVTDAQSALGLSSKDAAENLENMSRVSNVLVKANTLANATVEQFSKSLTNKVGAALRQTNKDIEEGVAVLAALADQGIKGEEAGTALSIVMRDLQTKALDPKLSSSFRELGISVFDANGNMMPMVSIISQLEKRLVGASAETQKLTLMQLGFTDKSVGFLQTLIGTSDKIRDYEAALRDAGIEQDVLNEIAGKQMSPIEEGWARLSGTITEVASKVATDLGPRFKQVFDRLSDFILRHLPQIERFFSFLLDSLDKTLELADIISGDPAGFAKKVGSEVLRNPFKDEAGNYGGLAGWIFGSKREITDASSEAKKQTKILQSIDENGLRITPVDF